MILNGTAIMKLQSRYKTLNGLAGKIGDVWIIGQGALAKATGANYL